MTSDHGQDHGAVLRVHSASEPTTLNPLRHEAKNLDTSVISTCVLHALNYVDADGTYRPQLLAQPPQAEDGGLTYAYRLREDRRWQDGRPVSAQDVAFTHRLMMDPDSGIPERDGYDLVEGIEIRSDTEFRLRLARPYPGFRDLFISSTGSIMPRHLLEGTDFSSDWDTSLRPASGPFRLSEWLRGGGRPAPSQPRLPAHRVGDRRHRLRVRPRCGLPGRRRLKAVHIGLPTSNVHLKNSVRKDRTWLLSTAKDMVKYAKDQGCFVSISAEDIGRTEIGFLQEYAAAVHEAGADRLRLSDTIGILDPAGYAERVRAVVEASDIDPQMHCHNDFGLAVANTLAGLAAGGRYFHVTVNSVGERAGMPDFAQMVLALKQFHGVDLGIDLTRLKEVSRIVAEACDQDVAPWQPVVGDNVFAHESGIHTNGMLRDSSTFEPFPPELVGGERLLVVGKHSGRAMIRHLLEEEGVGVDDSLIDECLVEVRELAIRNRSTVSTPELVDLYKKVSASASVGI